MRRRLNEQCRPAKKNINSVKDQGTPTSQQQRCLFQPRCPSTASGFVANNCKHQRFRENLSTVPCFECCAIPMQRRIASSSWKHKKEHGFKPVSQHIRTRWSSMWCFGMVPYNGRSNSAACKERLTYSPKKASRGSRRARRCACESHGGDARQIRKIDVSPHNIVARSE